MLTSLLTFAFSLNLFSAKVHAQASQVMSQNPGDRYSGVGPSAPLPSAPLPPTHRPPPPPRPVPPRPATYFDWGFGNNGYTYCFEWSNGYKTTGQPIANYLCEQYAPSYYYWGQAMNGYGACFQFNSNGYVLNTGYPVYNINCERVARSYFAWGPWNYCYQYTPTGLIMNNGQVFPPGYCY